jgi:hypothetical protein
MSGHRLQCREQQQLERHSYFRDEIALICAMKVLLNFSNSAALKNQAANS